MDEVSVRVFENPRVQCAHRRVSPTKEIRGEVTTTVYGEHWRCENCNLEFKPVQPPAPKESDDAR